MYSFPPMHGFKNSLKILFQGAAPGWLFLLLLALVPTTPKALTSGSKNKNWAAKPAEKIADTAIIKLAGELGPEDFQKIRVRIFPHRRNYAPQGIDLTQNRFRLISEKTCAVYEGQVNRAAKGKRLLTKTKVLHVNAVRLRIPLWVECSKPVLLERPDQKDNSYHYTGPIYISAKRDKLSQQKILQAVNVLSLETYLEGVVPAEIQAGWPLDSLKSQAVAARTYAVFHLSYARKFAKDREFDVDDSIVFQVYTGLSKIHPRTDQAVRETVHQVLTYENNIIQAYYHADSGGYTAGAKRLFNLDAPYCQSKREPVKVAERSSKWQKMISLAEMNARLSSRGILDPMNPIVAVNVSAQEPRINTRVMALDLTLRSGEIKVLPISSFKRDFPLDSLLFTLRTQNDTGYNPNLVFTGRGSGHGVGMNQRGARDLAFHYNWDYKKILAFYYSGTSLCQIGPGRADMPSCFPKREVQWAGF